MISSSTDDQQQQRRPAPLAVSADSVVLLSIGAAVAAAHPVPLADLFFAVAYPCYMALTNEWRFGGNVVGAHRRPTLRQRLGAIVTPGSRGRGGAPSLLPMQEVPLTLLQKVGTAL